MILADLRKGKGITQEVMAQRLKISVGAYNGYETGKLNVPATIAIDIAKIIKKPVNKIFKVSKFTVCK